jgi:hypothetical protein
MLRAERIEMNPRLQIALAEVEWLTHQAERLLPCWDELLEQAHAVSEQIQEHVQKVAADTDPAP